jgi:hypothetical protein
MSVVRFWSNCWLSGLDRWHAESCYSAKISAVMVDAPMPLPIKMIGLRALSGRALCAGMTLWQQTPVGAELQVEKASQYLFGHH